MVTKITNGVKVIVEIEYQIEYSNPNQCQYFFTYQITIENESKHSIQLLDRHWFIFDAGYLPREVVGKGVLGKQPIIASRQRYSYVSGCVIKSGFGKMVGTYKMLSKIDGSTFIVNIPEFNLIHPLRLN